MNATLNKMSKDRPGSSLDAVVQAMEERQKWHLYSFWAALMNLGDYKLHTVAADLMVHTFT